MSEKDLKQRFPTIQKMRMVADTWRLGEEEVGRFMRKHGISTVELESWKTQMKAGLDVDKPFSRQERTQYQDQIKKLKKELKQAKLLVEFQKKVQQLALEGGALSTPKKPDKPLKSSAKSGKKKG